MLLAEAHLQQVKHELEQVAAAMRHVEVRLRAALSGVEEKKVALAASLSSYADSSRTLSTP